MRGGAAGVRPGPGSPRWGRGAERPPAGAAQPLLRPGSVGTGGGRGSLSSPLSWAQRVVLGGVPCEGAGEGPWAPESVRSARRGVWGTRGGTGQLEQAGPARVPGRGPGQSGGGVVRRPWLPGAGPGLPLWLGWDGVRPDTLSPHPEYDEWPRERAHRGADVEQGARGAAALWLFGPARAEGKEIRRRRLQLEEALVCVGGFLPQGRPPSGGENRVGVWVGRSLWNCGSGYRRMTPPSTLSSRCLSSDQSEVPWEWGAGWGSSGRRASSGLWGLRCQGRRAKR